MRLDAFRFLGPDGLSGEKLLVVVLDLSELVPLLVHSVADLQDRQFGASQAALELDPAGRAAFLENACADDADLKAEVQSLLDHDVSSADFLEKPAAEAVDHPAHYGGDTVYETIKVIRAWGLDRNFCLANAVKYLSRAGKKDPTKTLEDLRKAAWYLADEIKHLEGATK